MIAALGADIENMSFVVNFGIRIGAGLIGLLAIYKSIVSPIRSHFKRLVEIQKEFYPNGGGSLRDVVNHGAVSIEQIMSDQRIILRKVTSLETIRTIEHEHSAVAIVKFDENLKLIEANPAAQKLLGGDLEQLRWFGWKNYLEEAYVDRITTLMEVAAEEKRRVAADVIIKRTKSNGITAAFSFVPVVCEKQVFFGFWALVTPLSPEI